MLLSIDLIKNNDLLHGLNESEKEEINYYMNRVSSRLATVDLTVKTIRDPAQEESLHQVNVLIDSLITPGDSFLSRQRCQTFVNACGIADPQADPLLFNVDKKFENALLGCTLDDQKNIKKRLQALSTYLYKQTVTD